MQEESHPPAPMEPESNPEPQPQTEPKGSEPSTTNSADEKEKALQNLGTLARRREAYKEQNKPKDLFLCDMETYFANGLNRKIPHGYYNVHSVISQDDPDKIRFSELFKEMKDKQVFEAEKLGLSLEELRGIGAVMGMGIGDALGASTEFECFKKQGLGIIKEGFADIHKAIMQGKMHGRHNKVAVWTDDASMGLSMGDSILLNDYEWNPKHMRYMFTMWLEHGLNNGGREYSIGLGGNISISTSEFMRHQEDYTQEGNRFNNGNGSLMRLATVPVAYHTDLQKAIEYSGLSSRTTHNGAEAEECCRLMGNIIVALMHRPEGADGKAVLLEVCDKFESRVESVSYLAKGRQEPQELFEKCAGENKAYKRFNKSIEDRNWNWREKEHTYSPRRFKQQPGYIGSYCMDALSMALHTVMFSESFKEVVCRNADMGGDCDTVGSIAGQIAGALWGIDASMLKLYSQMDDFTEGRYEVFMKGYKLVGQRMLK